MLKIFVGSSTIAKRQAKLFIEGCQNDFVTFLPWWDHITPGRTLLDELRRIRNEVNAAILLLTPEAIAVTSKGKEIAIPNLNVMFEFGYFYGQLGRANVAVVKYGKVILPSDLGGYIHIFGSDWFKDNSGNPASHKTKIEFKKWLDALISNK